MIKNMMETPERGPSREAIKIRIKEILFEGLQIAPEIEPRETEEIEDIKDFGEERRLKEIQEEKILNFKEGIRELVDVMDSSWVDIRILVILNKSRENLGFNIPKIVEFLNNLRELKQNE